MSTDWSKRKGRLANLLQSRGDEDDDGLALDRLLHGQSVIGKTSKTTEVDSLRFTDKDLTIVGTLEYGQFAVIDVVNCNIDHRVYIRKSIEKRFAFKTRDQCNPQLERDILLRALREKSVWAPHLLCAFQTPTHLNLVMAYAEGGTLWDVLESSPHERILEPDLLWWFPQVVSAVAWCHEQGFVHRDIKPHNFVITQDSHVQLIDFGSAAPLLPAQTDGTRLVPRQHCLVPCGTCDYISPEILQAHEAALVALEISEDDADGKSWAREISAGGYGVETDWWSMGAMLYEMAYGIAPFFAKDIRGTYLKIVDYRKSLKFKRDVSISRALEDMLRRLLTDAQTRLGRQGVQEIMDHPFFAGISWIDLHTLGRPDNLHIPLFAYNEQVPPPDTSPALDASRTSLSHSQGFAFSAFFQPSENGSPNLSVVRSATRPSRSILREQATSFFIGFSWGPTVDAFPMPIRASLSPTTYPEPHLTPRAPSIKLAPATLTPFRTISASTTPFRYPFATPLRPSVNTPHGMSTLPRASTIRRTAPRRAVSDREAMRQLVDCIGLSARKKVLASGRTPRTPAPSAPGTMQRGAGGTAKALRFMPAPINIMNNSFREHIALGGSSDGSGVAGLSLMSGMLDMTSEEGSEEGSVGIPPSPSPSPRPGSAMSMLSRRSATPTTATATGTWSLQLPPGWGGIGARRSTSPSALTVNFDLETSRKSLLEDSRQYDRQTSVNLEVPRAANVVPRASEDEDEGMGDAFGALEHRYTRLMDDIKNIEGQLGSVRRAAMSKPK